MNDVRGSDVVEQEGTKEVDKEVGRRSEQRSVETVWWYDLFDITKSEWWFGRWGSLDNYVAGGILLRCTATRTHLSTYRTTFSV